MNAIRPTLSLRQALLARSKHCVGIAVSEHSGIDRCAADGGTLAGASNTFTPVVKQGVNQDALYPGCVTS